MTKCNFLLRGGQVKIDDSGLPLPTKNENQIVYIFSSLCLVHVKAIIEKSPGGRFLWNGD